MLSTISQEQEQLTSWVDRRFRSFEEDPSYPGPNWPSSGLPCGQNRPALGAQPFGYDCDRGALPCSFRALKCDEHVAILAALTLMKINFLAE